MPPLPLIVEEGTPCLLHNNNNNNNKAAPVTLLQPIQRDNHRRVHFSTTCPVVHLIDKVPWQDRTKLWYSRDEEIAMCKTYCLELQRRQQLMIRHHNQDDEIDDLESQQPLDFCSMNHVAIQAMRCLLFVYALLVWGLDQYFTQNPAIVEEKSSADDVSSAWVPCRAVMNFTL